MTCVFKALALYQEEKNMNFVKQKEIEFFWQDEVPS